MKLHKRLVGLVLIVVAILGPSSGIVQGQNAVTIDGSVVIVALNKAAANKSISFKLENVAVGSQVESDVTNNDAEVAQRPNTTLADHAFTGMIPGRSLVTFFIPADGN